MNVKITYSVPTSSFRGKRIIHINLFYRNFPYVDFEYPTVLTNGQEDFIITLLIDARTHQINDIQNNDFYESFGDDTENIDTPLEIKNPITYNLLQFLTYNVFHKNDENELSSRSEDRSLYQYGTFFQTAVELYKHVNHDFDIISTFHDIFCKVLKKDHLISRYLDTRHQLIVLGYELEKYTKAFEYVSKETIKRVTQRVEWEEIRNLKAKDKQERDEKKAIKKENNTMYRSLQKHFGKECNFAKIFIQAYTLRRRRRWNYEGETMYAGKIISVGKSFTTIECTNGSVRKAQKSTNLTLIK